jgi:hypothetical protein
MSNMEITLGKATFGKQNSAYAGVLIKISSVKGKIVSIEAGRASCVAMIEHEDDGKCVQLPPRARRLRRA